MQLSKENCKRFKMESTHKETGVITTSLFITHPMNVAKKFKVLGEFAENFKITELDPSWRDRLVYGEHPEFGEYFRLSSSTVEALD